MRRVLTLAVLACTALIASVGTATAAPPSDSSALREALTVDGMQEHMAALQEIADENNDTRASGTSGYDASLDYVMGQLDPEYFDITVQEFEFDVFRELAPAEMEQISPTPRTYNEDEVATMDYSGNGDVTGELVATNDIVIPPGAEASTSNSGCEPTDFVDVTTVSASRIALIQRGTCDFVVKAENAENAGYDAVIIFNEGQEGRQETLLGTLGADADLDIPVVGTSFAIGSELYAQLNGGAAVTMRVETLGEILLDQPTANLIAKTKTGRTDRQVVVGAHLDSVHEGPGINDNGSGTAQNLEIAQAMAEGNVAPRNQVVFAWWGAEESGLIGSQFYVDQLSKPEIKDIAVNLNYDMVASPNYVRFVYDGDASDTDSTASTGSGVVERVHGEYFDSVGLQYEPTAFDGRSDYDAFVNVGIPAGGTFTGAEDVKTAEEQAIYGGMASEQYDPCYHEACDTFSSVFDFPVIPGRGADELSALDGNGAKGLDEMSDAAAHATWTFAQTTSAIEGTSRGNANGQYDPERLGANLRK